MCALQWGDISFVSGTIRIHKTILLIQDLAPEAQQKTKILIDCPKTESSNRVIPMPTFLLTFLEPHRRAEDIYLLTGTRAYLEPRICLDKYKRILTQAGLDSFTVHTLRHTFSTRCIENGFDPKSLSGNCFHFWVKAVVSYFCKLLEMGTSGHPFSYCSTLRVKPEGPW